MRHLFCSHRMSFFVAFALFTLVSRDACAFPIITNVVETGGDNETSDTVPAKWTGVTFPVTVANEPVPGLSDGSTYTVGPFGNHAPAMVDRNHRYTNASDTVLIPSYLAGGEYIMSGNDNRDNAGYLLDVSVGSSVQVYLLIDNRLGGNNADPPTFGAAAMQWVLDEEWLPVTNGLNRVGSMDVPDEIAIDEGADGTLNQWFSIYTKSFPAGTFQLKQPDNAGQNMYGVVVTLPADSVDNPPRIVSLAPTNNTLFYDAARGISFMATTVSPNSIAPGNIHLSLNGTDISSNLVVGGSANSRTVGYSNLVANTIYRARIAVLDQNGRATTNDFSFDTFSPTTAVAIEAEDYNHGSGQFLNPPTPGGYTGLAGTPEIDYHDNNTATAAAEYRTSDFVGLATSADGPRQYFTDAGATDYQVNQFWAGDWMNYTRAFNNQTYDVYLRVAGAVAQPVRLDKVTGAGLANQTAFPLGAFTVASTPYAYIPLTDIFGNAVKLNFSGPNTLRLTALYSANPSLQLNFVLLVPTAASARPPYISEASPAVNAVNVPLDSALKITVANGTTQVAPASLVLSFNGSNVTAAATVSPSAGGIAITYDPPGNLETNRVNTVRVTFNDTAGAPVTNEWSFRTAPYRPIIVSVVETDGDDPVNAPAQFTGQTFNHPNLGPIRLGTFQEDAPAYRSRLHQWNGAGTTLPLPDYLVGGEYIMILQENRDNTPYQLEVAISEPALVYLLIDNRLGGNNADPPTFGPGAMQWVLDEGWTPVLNGLNRNNNPNVPDEVGMDEGGDGVGPGIGLNQWSSVYVKRVQDSIFTLLQPDNAGQNMYGVVVRPLATHVFTPTVAITTPTNGAALPLTSTAISLAADASVENSSITNVEFFYGVLNKVKIGEDTSGPFQVGWSNVPPGRYVLTAKATAANGRSVVSAPITVLLGEVLSVNFQANTATVPPGYLADYGDIFADRGNGHSYGWDDNNTAHARDRNDARSPDERYDTFNHLQKTDPLPAGRIWEIELANGRYSLQVVVGEPSNQDSVYDLTAEGTTIVTGTPDAVVRWFEATATVTVSDGRLTLGNGPTAANNKICFVDIATLPTTVPQPVFAPPTLNGTTLSLSWTGGGRLQQAPDVTGPWTNVPGDPQGSLTGQTTGPRMFYRVISR